MKSVIKILVLYLYEATRLFRFTSDGKNKRSRYFLLRRNLHGLEKSLTYDTKKPWPSLKTLALLSKNLEFLIAEEKIDRKTIKYVISVVAGYLASNKEFEGGQQNIALCNSILLAAGKQLGREVEVPKPKTFYEPLLLKDEFRLVINNRRSVRFFLEGIPNEVLREIIKVSDAVPSACNRRPWSARILTEPEIAAAIAIQNGNTGFGKTIKSLLLITCDRSSLQIWERNGTYIDGGAYAFSIMLGIAAYGYASVPLNLSLSISMEMKFRRSLKVPASDDLIMLIGCGLANKNLAIPDSGRAIK